MRIVLPWPDKLLWSNGGSGNRFAVARAKKAARHAASWATIEARGAEKPQFGEDIPVTILVYPKRYGPVPDKDNCLSACKVQLDAIAEQLGVNDRRFSPAVEFAPERTGKIEVIL